MMIGTMQHPKHRKSEIDDLAQRELTRLVFRVMTCHRLQAWSEGTSIAGQRAPEEARPRRGSAARGSRCHGARCGTGVPHRAARADAA
ncbi:hypothetical protein DVH02_01025 [Streptomyces corynorhini]|uniref:Uncharacterized protein n=1 Tax=Streptomyces corynorhini TaxID=2282652 RepID=A0A370BDT7_9ACTN|nr:hypothetical protein DVH02_01025 [Streptomyces corynorhini]